MTFISDAKISLRRVRSSEGESRFSREMADGALLGDPPDELAVINNARVALLGAGLSPDQITGKLINRYIRGEWKPRRMRGLHV